MLCFHCHYGLIVIYCFQLFYMKGGNMRKFGFGSLFTLILIFVAGLFLSPLYAGSDPPTMTKEELKVFKVLSSSMCEGQVTGRKAKTK
jgi:hypothetical protein